MAVVYQHLKKDTREIFYVGISKDVYRAYNKNKRSTFWKRIVEKHDYIVDVLCKDISYEEAKEIEKFLIGIYGRENLGTGILCNLTDGGEGTVGRVTSKEHRLKIGESKLGNKNMLGKKHKDESKMKMSTSRKSNKPVIQLDKNGNFINRYHSIGQASRVTNTNQSDIAKACKNKLKSAGGFKWKYDEN